MFTVETCQGTFTNLAGQEEWNRYVLAHKLSSPFHLAQWQNVIKKTFNHKSHHLVAKDSNQSIVGVLPLFEIKSHFFGHFLVSVPFAERGGALADNQKIALLLTDRAKECARDCGAAYLELKNLNPHPGLPTKDLYFSFSRPILPSVEENLLAIPRKSRAMVRKGHKAGLKAEWGHHLLEEFYLVLAKNYHRLGTPIFPKSLFCKFLEEFRERVNFTVIRKPSGQIIAGVMSFFYQGRIMPYYAGSLMEHRHVGPNDFMYWSLIEYGCEQGYEVFDFGRSKTGTGSFSFKKNWGFEPEPLAYQYFMVNGGDLPDLSPLNPRFQKKIQLWQKMPFVLTKILGPQLAKYLA